MIISSLRNLSVPLRSIFISRPGPFTPDSMNCRPPPCPITITVTQENPHLTYPRLTAILQAVHSGELKLYRANDGHAKAGSRTLRESVRPLYSLRRSTTSYSTGCFNLHPAPRPGMDGAIFASPATYSTRWPSPQSSPNAHYPRSVKKTVAPPELFVHSKELSTCGAV